MRNALACIALIFAFALVCLGIGSAPAPLTATGSAKVVRLLPAAALLDFEGGAFTVVPRSALRPDVAPGDLLDLRLLAPGETRLALASPAPRGTSW